MQNIHVTAWGPLTIDRQSQLNVATDTQLTQIAQTIDVQPTQLALSWALKRGTSVIPKSVKEDRMRSNLKRRYKPLCGMTTVVVSVLIKVVVELSDDVFDMVAKLQMPV